ncbi:hypothetical protein [Haloglomus litoreum]|nr:hypothetical protein [Haloglomus sp. DT116]
MASRFLGGPSVLVDGAEVPSASTAPIDDALETEGHLTALAFLE